MLVKLYTLEFVNGDFHSFNWTTKEECEKEYNRERGFNWDVKIVEKEFDAEYVIKKNNWFSDYAKEYCQKVMETKIP